MNHSLPLSDYLTRILTASVYDVAVETPLDLARSLSGRLNNQVLLKREDLQPVFSFKIRPVMPQAIPDTDNDNI